jgi:tetratricopeptide (TPR) repeat protein
LAVFAGGFTLAAAEAMEDADGDLAAFDGVVGLVEHSLLRQIAGVDTEPRYRMLETVREFGLEQLTLAGEEDEARQRHARHYLRLSDELWHSAYGVLHRAKLLQRMASELDNVRLTLAWCDEHHEIDALLRVISVFWGLWHARGLYIEGLALVERALAQSSPRASVARIQALSGAGMMAVFHGDYARAATLIDKERALAQELGDPYRSGMALCNSGLLIARHGEYGRAEALFREALGLARVGTDETLEGWAHLWIGDMALDQAHFDQAAAHYAEALDIFKATDWDWALADVNAGLGGVSYCTGDLAGAAEHYGQSLERAWQLGVTMLAVGPLLGLAGVAAEFGNAEQGARLFGAAEGIMASLGAPIFPRDRPARDRAFAALTTLLGEDHSASIREAGRILTFEQAVAEARTVAEKFTGLPS